ncbi:MAG: hypothetical protein ACR2QF_08500, partial [Geminicoccaceae bacterium]
MPRRPIVRAALIGLGLLPLFVSAAAAAEEKLHHELDVFLDPAASKLVVTDRIKVSGHSTLAIKLAPGLELNEALIDGNVVSPTTDDGVLWIELASEEANEVTLSYGGVLKRDDSRGGLSPLLAEEGGFLPYGLGWLANGGAENDWVTYELNVTSPAPYQVVATGEMTEETEDNGEYKATFVATHRTEPPSIFAGEFKIDERDHEG